MIIFSFNVSSLNWVRAGGEKRRVSIPAEIPLSCQIKGGVGHREEEERLKEDAFLIESIHLFPAV